MAKRRTTRSIEVASLRHTDKRANIPTQELRDFVATDEDEPSKLLYPRDPSLDPQLVWKGKDEQDRQPLEAPSVPVYIQDKIQPQAIIDDLLRQRRSDEGDETQLSFFDNFNGIEFDQMVDFYRHEQNWSNRMILGDSLLVMASLAEKEGLKGKVQMIYIDPPYGIKFGSNWQVSTRNRDVRDGRPTDLTRQPEQIRAFRDTWELGIHSYLAYLRDRLVSARDLLTDTGSVFVQIGDENVHLVRCILDEVFGSDNFVSLVTFTKTASANSPLAKLNALGNVADHIVWYAKHLERIKYRPLFQEKVVGGTGGSAYNRVHTSQGERRLLTRTERLNPDVLDNQSRIHRLDNLTSTGWSESLSAPFEYQSRFFELSGNLHWKTTGDGLRRLTQAGRMEAVGRSLAYVRNFDDFAVIPRQNVWTDTGTGGFGEEKIYVVQTGSKVVERCMLMTTDPGDLVFDPTCGSGTTAYVAEQWGRRWITTDTSRVALTLARTRLMAARYPWYLLADSPEGGAKETEITGVEPQHSTEYTQDVRKGFVYERVPHVTLRAIANNEEIDEIHERWQKKLEPLRSVLNDRLGTCWEEWEIPREPESEGPDDAKQALDEWWRLRRERQNEIDASIARSSDTELLYDQPYADSKRVRVTGPFTVESLSPHRVLTTEEDRPASETDARHESTNGQFEITILENLRVAGVQNTRRDERLEFARLEPYAGTWIHAEGEYVDTQGESKRVAISIGPEHGTVGPAQIKEAAKEALRGVGFDLLVVCGFAFDAHANESAREFQPDEREPSAGVVAEATEQYGKLPVMLARMNPDLLMGDELKKTGAANLFMVFGEPDLEIRPADDGRMIVELKGVDVFDPTTGQIRNSSTDDIACWFIDTDYNEESFFVRQAYFTGGDEPYKNLQRTLRAQVDETAWASLYSTVSRPFERPSTSKIAVKVINHYGDEVLKVYPV